MELLLIPSQKKKKLLLIPKDNYPVEGNIHIPHRNEKILASKQAASSKKNPVASHDSISNLREEEFCRVLGFVSSLIAVPVIEELG